MTISHRLVDLSAPNLQRLVDQVETRQLHKGSSFDDPRAWLENWLTTPEDDLNGRKPAIFLQEPDCDLILVGLLIRKQTRIVWKAPRETGLDSSEALVLSEA